MEAEQCHPTPTPPAPTALSNRVQLQSVQPTGQNQFRDLHFTSNLRAANKCPIQTCSKGFQPLLQSGHQNNSFHLLWYYPQRNPMY